jgi:hypothetical protein
MVQRLGAVKRAACEVRSEYAVRTASVGPGAGRPKQVRQVRALGLEVAAGDRGIDSGHGVSCRSIEALLLEYVDILLHGQIAVGDLRAGDRADGLGKLEQIEGRPPTS